MATGRKKHPHPPLTPPRSVYRVWFDKGNAFKEKVRHDENDEGKVVDGRIYTFHPTKGWRNRRFSSRGAA